MIVQKLIRAPRALKAVSRTPDNDQRSQRPLRVSGAHRTGLSVFRGWVRNRYSGATRVFAVLMSDRIAATRR